MYIFVEDRLLSLRKILKQALYFSLVCGYLCRKQESFLALVC